MQQLAVGKRGRRMAAATLLALAVSIGFGTTSRADVGPTRAVGASEIPLTATAVARNADGRMVMFAIDIHHILHVRTQTTAGSDTWSRWSQLATDTWTLAAATNGNGLIELFGTDHHGQLFHSWQLAPNSRSWSEWTRFANDMSNAPSTLSVTAAANGALTLFGLDPYGKLWGKTQYIGSNGSNGDGSWSPWGGLNGTYSTIAAQTNGNGLIELFGTTDIGYVYHLWEQGHNTGSWGLEYFGRLLPAPSTITATRTGPGGTVVVFSAGADTGIWGRTAYIGPNGSNGGGSWSPHWSRIDGYLSSITAFGNPDRRIELFGVTSWGDLLRRKELAAGTGSWSPWIRVDLPTS
jgi:hypothetical protein